MTLRAALSESLSTFSAARHVARVCVGEVVLGVGETRLVALEMMVVRG